MSLEVVVEPAEALDQCGRGSLFRGLFLRIGARGTAVSRALPCWPWTRSHPWGPFPGTREFVAGLMSGVGGLEVSAGLSAASPQVSQRAWPSRGLFNRRGGLFGRGRLGGGFGGRFSGWLYRDRDFSVWAASVWAFLFLDFLAAPGWCQTNLREHKRAPRSTLVLNGLVANGGRCLHWGRFHHTRMLVLCNNRALQEPGSSMDGS